MAVRIQQTIFRRWIVVDADDPTRAWSGFRFVEIDERGLGKIVQVSNFTDRAEATEYARSIGLEVRE